MCACILLLLIIIRYSSQWHWRQWFWYSFTRGYTHIFSRISSRLCKFNSSWKWEETSGEETQTNMFQCFTHHFTCKILCSALCILSVVRVSSVSMWVCVCVTLCSQTFMMSDGSSIVPDKHGCIIFVCSIGWKNRHICIYPSFYTYNDIHAYVVSC